MTATDRLIAEHEAYYQGWLKAHLEEVRKARKAIGALDFTAIDGKAPRA